MSEIKDGLIKEENVGLKVLESEGGVYGDRSASYVAWKECPVPGRKDEYWKYTSLTPLLKRSYGLILNTKPFSGEIVRDQNAYSLVFVNGHFSSELSDEVTEKGIRVLSLRNAMKDGLIDQTSAIAQNDYFGLLNQAFFTDGPFISIDPNVKLEKPLHIIHAITEKDGLFNLRTHINLGKGAEAKVVERWQCADSSQNLINTHMDIQAAENAELEFIKLQFIGQENSLISQDFIRQKADSRTSLSTFCLQGKLIRNNVNVALMGENAESNLNGLFIAGGDQHVDNHTFVDHAVPHCQSNELYKGVLEGNAKGVFNGKVIVRQDAQKTNAFQYNGNMLLSDSAQIYSKPELEIYADDVKCSHGSTTGQLDEEAMFYLMSRGISPARSRQLLIYAFAGEVLEKVGIPSIREELDHYLTEHYHIDKDA